MITKIINFLSALAVKKLRALVFLVVKNLKFLVFINRSEIINMLLEIGYVGS